MVCDWEGTSNDLRKMEINAYLEHGHAIGYCLVGQEQGVFLNALWCFSRSITESTSKQTLIVLSINGSCTVTVFCETKCHDE